MSIFRNSSLDKLVFLMRRALVGGSLPDFLIIGAQKAGTSSLYDLILQHPSIAERLKKEIHYFNAPSSRLRGTQWYTAHFPSVLEKSLHRWRLQQPLLAGEATPFMIHPHAPRLVHELTPRVRLIAILRDPIWRAYSHYHHNRRRPGREPLSFERAVEWEHERIDGDYQKMLADPEHSGSDFLKWSYCTRGRYADQLERWRLYFPEDQILVLDFEQLINTPQVVATRVFQFLGLSDHKLITHNKANVGSYSRTVPPDVAAYLAGYFREPNSRLYRMLDRNVGWLSPAETQTGNAESETSIVYETAPESVEQRRVA